MYVVIDHILANVSGYSSLVEPLFVWSPSIARIIADDLVRAIEASRAACKIEFRRNPRPRSKYMRVYSCVLVNIY